MKRIIFFIYLILFFLNINAQNISDNSDSLSGKNLYNSYGMLRKDDPEYNKKSIWIKPAAEVIGINAITWTIDRYVFNHPFSHIGPDTWKNNLKEGWKWDNDQLRVNFLGHPYSGTLTFNAGRSSGYGYFQSIPFAIGGSLMWEYFGENTRPSYNDLINTPISGAFLGEILYRLSSNILKDNTRGGERIIRELIAAVLNPVRGFNRLTQGKTFRVVSKKEVYQKEPLNITLMGGLHTINNGSDFGSGQAYPMLNIQLDYGDPFEIRKRRPFDLFRFRADFTFGKRIKVPYVATGYGLLVGNSFKKGNSMFLTGGFQHYDYWNNKNFQMASMGFGVGLINKFPISGKSDLYSAFHIAAVPIAGINPLQGAVGKYRNYNYGGGFEGKFESTLNFGKWASISLNGYYYWIRSYVGTPGNNMVGILKPKISFWISRSVSIGMEEFIYYTSGKPQESRNINRTTTEQKFFLQLFLENPERSGSRYQ